MFEHSWDRCWRGLGAGGDGHGLMDKLLEAYSEPQRHYHTTQHLGECLALFDQHRHEVSAWAEVEIALWFHDAVYDVRAHDNEARSADWAGLALSLAGVASERVERVQALILATRHQAQPMSPEEALVVDIDLAILGADPARFEEYDAQIRAEYAWVPRLIYRQKRRAILRSFLERDPLYHIGSLRQLLEAQARVNLANFDRPFTVKD